MIRLTLTGHPFATKRLVDRLRETFDVSGVIGPVPAPSAPRSVRWFLRIAMPATPPPVTDPDDPD